MIGAGSLEFAHARIWARWGQRADESVWRRIEATRELAAVLEVARASDLARWLHGLPAEWVPGQADTLHRLGPALRRHWRAQVAELQAWMPMRWGRAIACCALLVELPLLQHLARGGPAPAWMADDDGLRALLDTDTEPGQAGLTGASNAGGVTRTAVRTGIVAAPAGPALRELLEAARADPDRLLALWLERWRALLPRGSERRAIEQQLLPLLAAHAAAFGAAMPADAWPQRHALRQRLATLLRRAPVQPMAAFVHLALLALEFERLRGELIRRAAFPRRPPLS